ncbi:lipoprotein [Ignatzschineria sp. RMDPL8A]|nr:lipoprotein [Ignatzschineria sp. RMDPL8A]MDG9729205.1 lipoprotein [Ignatzschineria sp. RMDPL8A]
MTLKRLLLLSLVAMSLLSCGQKGPLYLPDHSQEEVRQ